MEQAKKENCVTTPSSKIVELAELMVDTVASADWAFFMKNGNDTTQGAIMCARAYTHRKKIIFVNGFYHGVSMWTQKVDYPGVLPEDAADFCRSLSDFPNLNLRGFMTMAPHCENSEDYRKFFRETFRQGLDIWEKTLHNIGRPVFSMGMSESFEPAIEEGATIVRVGRSLFAERPAPNTNQKEN